MQELLSYRLSDLLLFSEQSYLRQFELYNHWLAPGQWLVYLYGILFLFSLRNPQPYFSLILFAISSLFWLICAYGFLWQFYAAINWIVAYFVVIFIIQSLLILWAGYISYSRAYRINPGIPTKSGLLIWLASLFAQPAFEFYSGRTTEQISVFALTPDSLSFTAIALMLIFDLSAWFFLPAGLWLLFSTLTYLAMNSMNVIFPAFALAVYLLSIFARPLSKPQKAHME